MDVKVRKARSADVSAMHHIRRSVRQNRLARSTDISEASYPPYIDAGGTWVAELGSAIVGFAALDRASASIWALFVDPEMEGAGIGRTLHDAMIDLARADGLSSLSLRTEAGSRAATFYRAAGWTEAASHADGELELEYRL